MNRLRQEKNSNVKLGRQNRREGLVKKSHDIYRIYGTKVVLIVEDEDGGIDGFESHSGLLEEFLNASLQNTLRTPANYSGKLYRAIQTSRESSFSSSCSTVTFSAMNSSATTTSVIADMTELCSQPPPSIPEKRSGFHLPKPISPEPIAPELIAPELIAPELIAPELIAPELIASGPVRDLSSSSVIHLSDDITEPCPQISPSMPEKRSGFHLPKPVAPEPVASELIQDPPSSSVIDLSDDMAEPCPQTPPPMSEILTDLPLPEPVTPESIQVLPPSSGPSTKPPSSTSSKATPAVVPRTPSKPRYPTRRSPRTVSGRKKEALLALLDNCF